MLERFHYGEHRLRANPHHKYDHICTISDEPLYIDTYCITYTWIGTKRQFNVHIQVRYYDHKPSFEEMDAMRCYLEDRFYNEDCEPYQFAKQVKEPNEGLKSKTDFILDADTGNLAQVGCVYGHAHQKTDGRTFHHPEDRVQFSFRTCTCYHHDPTPMLPLEWYIDNLSTVWKRRNDRRTRYFEFIQ